MLFWLYAPLLAIYMRIFAYLCIMVWIQMDAHEYICCFFQNLNILCIFWSTGFLVQFFSSSIPVHIFGVSRFGHQSDSDNIGTNTHLMSSNNYFRFPLEANLDLSWKFIQCLKLYIMDI
jgi:hypothetical protein